MDVLIRDISEKTVEELQKRAADNNRSLQAELKAILDETANPSMDSTDIIRRHRDG
jgi:plasmid stability protein